MLNIDVGPCMSLLVSPIWTKSSSESNNYLTNLDDESSKSGGEDRVGRSPDALDCISRNSRILRGGPNLDVPRM
jgi:hypothetical protein